ncbi:hypothetical protein BK816_00185 [Boudabousia tangfeifanii]|uniref:ABC transporter domain-containing protein n=1 Tax=Boudabousia tangfeifanii TaxID=1912795 RepID=A0A1D9MI89_9ACTO|nr:ABC transporter ATP-binding protein [Boudabousia tangfeifanii]AOZ71900.1 hypothetical protein BK816_00185 [Boudabousia tangfeifanii]
MAVLSVWGRWRREFGRGLRQFKFFWQVSPFLTLALCVLLVFLPVLSFLWLFAAGAVVSAFGAAGAPLGWSWRVWLLVLLLALCFEQLLSPLSQVLSQRLNLLTIARLQWWLAALRLAPSTVSVVEQPEREALLGRLSGESRDYLSRNATFSSFFILGQRFGAVGSFVVMCWWNPWLAFLLLFAMVLSGAMFTSYLTKLLSASFEQSGPLSVRGNYFHGLVSSASGARELKIFGAGSFFVGEFSRMVALDLRSSWGDRSRSFFRSLFFGALLAFVAVLILWFVGRDVLSGVLSLGGALAVLQAMNGFAGFGMMGDAAEHRARQQVQLEQLERLQRELGLPVTFSLVDLDVWRAEEELPVLVADLGGEAEGASGSGPLPGALESGLSDEVSEGAEVVVRGLRFAYPGSSRQVFESFDLRIPAGQHVAIVGINGCGKSTLMKLLGGLYLPDAGEVSIAGLPAVLAAQRGLVTTMFQDFMRYELSLVDNILLPPEGEALGVSPVVVDVERNDLALALLSQAGGDEVAARVGDPSRVLDNGYEGGTNLSGGQWQRVALARTLAGLEQGARVLILDEPTAALDVRVEKEIFDRFAALRRGRTSILVSHRLSTVRQADRIVVIDGGTVIEDGSHEELLALGGQYAQMFLTQASHYQQVSTDSGEVLPLSDGGECVE